MHIAYPFHFDGSGHTARATKEEHIKGMIRQYLLTRHGERCNRPDFGGNIIPFDPNSPVQARELETKILIDLKHGFGGLIDLGTVTVRATNSTVACTITYSIPGLTAPANSVTEVSWSR